MGPRFWISGIVASVLYCLLGFVVHETILHGDYERVHNIMRTADDAMSRMPFMFLAYLLMGFASAWIYHQGVRAGASWILQGVRFGIAIALVSAVPMYLIYYTVQPWPAATVAKQIFLQTVAVVIVGIVLAWINRSASRVDNLTR